MVTSNQIHVGSGLLLTHHAVNDKTSRAHHRNRQASKKSRRAHALWVIVLIALAGTTFDASTHVAYAQAIVQQLRCGTVSSPYSSTGETCVWVNVPGPGWGTGAPGGGPGPGPGAGGGGGVGAGKPFTSANTNPSNKKPLDRSPTDCTKKGTSGDTAGDPIEISTQSKIDSVTLFSQPGEGGLSYALNYTSPNGWYDNLGFRLVLNCGSPVPDSGPTCGYIKYYRGDGSIISFTGQAGTVGNYPESDGGGLATLTGNADGTYTLHDEDGSTKIFDGGGRISSIINPQGVKWTITVDAVGRPTKVTSSNGSSFTIARQSASVNGTTVWTVTVTDPAGNIYTYSYSTISPKIFLLNPMQLSSLTLPGSPATTITWKYLAGSFLVSEMDYNGTPYLYATYNSPSASFFPDGATGERLADGTGANSIVYSNFTYTGHSLTATLTNPLGHTTVKQYYWAGEGNPFLLTSNSESAVADCGATLSTIAYDSNGYLSKTVDADGNAHTYSYSANGQLQTETEASGTAIARTTSYGWDSNAQLNRLISATVVGESKTSYAYNAQNRLASVTRTNLTGVGTPNQSLTTSYAYTLYGSGMVQSVTATAPSPNGTDKVTTAYDAHGNLTSVTDGLGYATTYSNYNGLGEVGKIVGPNGDETDYTYDARGRVASKTTHPNGTTATWTYGYDGFGLLSQFSAPDGEVVTWSRDAEMRVKTITHNDKDGTATETFTYDADNDITSDVITRGSDIGKSTSYVYDALGRIYQIKGSHGQILTYAYDGNGNVLSVTDQLGHKTSYQYDALNRIAKTTDAAGGVTSLVYDAADHVTRMTDPRGLVTGYAWDGLDQLWQRQSPDTGTTNYGYDAYGRLSSFIRADGIQTYLGYDALNRLISKVAGGLTRTYTWDVCTNGKERLCAAANQGNDSVGYSYSPEGWITGRSFSFNGGPTYGLGYAYDNMGQLAVVDYPDGNQALYDYTDGVVADVRMKVGTYNITGVSGITYRPMDMAMSNWTSYNGLTNAVAYDSDLRPTSISVPNVENLTFTYDVANRIIGIANGINGGLSQTLGYDALNRLTTVTSGADNESYNYDANGNRTYQVINGAATSYSVAANSNRLNGVSGYYNDTYGYDADGDMTTLNGSPWWQYGPFGRLSGVGGWSYRTSAEGQRIFKSSTPGTTYFAPDADGTLMAEYQGPVSAWLDYVWLNGQLVTMITSNGGVYPVHDDQTGRPIAMTNLGNQSVIWAAQNFPFTTNVTTTTWFDFNARFPGQYYDKEDQVSYNGNRDYSEVLGRYIESDPIGLLGGINTYAYVGNNPISWVDLLGLKLCSTTLPGLGNTYMDSTLYPMVQNWISADAAAGISVTFTSAFRTTAHQANLGVGAITPAAAGHSLHEAGFAVDISWSSLSSVDQSIVLQNANAAGLSWGGDFRSPDPVHFYNDPGNRTQYIQAAQKDYQNGSASACKCGS